MKREKKEPLYRKEKKIGLSHQHPYLDTGGEYRWTRHSKAMNAEDAPNKMSIPTKNRGRDYTPLYRFLQSKAGKLWDDVFSEAVSRLDKQEPIWHVVQMGGVHEKDDREVGLVGESSQWRMMTVRDGIFEFVNPDALPYKPGCTCCTHTFDGKVISKDQPTSYPG